MTVVLLVLIIGLAIIATLVLMQPNRFTVARSAVIDAPPAAVFQRINNLRNWDAWSPWARLDPNAATSFDGPVAGPGAGFEWSGNKNVGAGRMAIVDSAPNQRVVIQLDMTKPLSASNEVVFTLTPELAENESGGWDWVKAIFGLGGNSNQKTRVEWRMSGEAGLVGKAMNLVMDRDKMCGKQFEEGLANLAAIFVK